MAPGRKTGHHQRSVGKRSTKQERESLAKSFRRTKAPSNSKAVALKAAPADKVFQEEKVVTLSKSVVESSSSGNQKISVEGDQDPSKGFVKRWTREEAERLLKNFDLTLDYGPCTDMKRSERYKRAVNYGLNPPQIVPELIECFIHEDPGINDNLWSRYNL